MEKTVKKREKKRALKLTPKQARFVEKYLVDLNATAAATRAGYSEKTAALLHEKTSQNLTFKN